MAKDKTILVVEDDPSSSEMLEEMLGLEDYAVETTDSVTETLLVLGARHFDAVLLDLSLPGAPLDDFVEMLRRLDRPSPLIVFSARPSSEVRVIAARLGAAAVLTKPSGMVEILTTIARVAG
jgi:DNA-binding response OmpR family regulator